MNYDRSMSNTDEYFMTAVQIFDCCGVEDCGAIRVNALMDKFAPFVKTDKAEFTHLKALLDPEECNPEINVTKLANALHRYSESQKCKVDLDESFNLRGGPLPQDSDSGISSDGLQLLEELQCELKEKEHLANQLRSQLDFSDRQHEETMAAIIAERDTLRRHITVLREENSQLTEFRAECDEVYERLGAAETALATQKRDNDTLVRRNNIQIEQIAVLEADKLTLQELLSKSKDECHRINEMYATRQSALIEENETLKSEHAELSTKLQDQEEFMQQIIKEKVLLEMELKDLLNKSNQTHLRLDRSIDVSYTEDQMLTALDTLNADSRFVQEHRLLDEDSFMNMFKDDPGRATNMSLFDEIRLSFYNKSRLTDSNVNCILDNSFVTSGTQTDDNEPYSDDSSAQNIIKNNANVNTIETQTEFEFRMTNTDSQTEIKSYVKVDKAQNTENDTKVKGTQTIGGLFKNRIKVISKKVDIVKKIFKSEYSQTDIQPYVENNNVHNGVCHECQNSNVERDRKYTELLLSEMEDKICNYEDNLNFLQNVIDEGKAKNQSLECMIENLKHKMAVLESACDAQKDVIDNIMTANTETVSCQTEFDHVSVSTQVETPCGACEKRKVSAPHRLRRFLWEPLKCLFQLFAVVCFVLACSALYSVSRSTQPCARAQPWRWLHAQEIMDLLLRIEYTNDVPM